jgi:plasmid stabilization system protein ParE
MKAAFTRPQCRASKKLPPLASGEREGSPIVAARFVAEFFKRLAALLLEHPGIGSPRSNGRRGFSMNVPPCTVISRVKAEGARIPEVKHDSKRPGYSERRS